MSSIPISPAPWSIAKRWDGEYVRGIVDAEGRDVIVAIPTDYSGGVAIDATDEDMQLAVAAPDLLAALEAAGGDIRHRGHERLFGLDEPAFVSTCPLCMARAAVKKARGIS